MATSPRYITDDSGNRIEVVININEYYRLLEAAEEIEELRAYDAAKASGDEAIPFEQALQEIEQQTSGAPRKR